MRTVFVGLILVMVVVFIATLPVISNAQTMLIPFGGKIQSEEMCNDGLLLTLGLPTPYQLIWHWGELPYLMYIPPHIGQYILGKASQAIEICMFGNFPVGVGFPIIFHGSSK
jgi:hypothetical protein